MRYVNGMETAVSSQKQEDHDDGHDDRVPEGVDHVVHAVVNQLLLRVGDIEVDIGILALQVRQRSESGIDGRQCETGKRALNIDANGGLAIAVKGGHALLHAPLDLADVA